MVVAAGIKPAIYPARRPCLADDETCFSYAAPVWHPPYERARFTLVGFIARSIRDGGADLAIFLLVGQLSRHSGAPPPKKKARPSLIVGGKNWKRKLRLKSPNTPYCPAGLFSP